MRARSLRVVVSLGLASLACAFGTLSRVQASHSVSSHYSFHADCGGGGIIDPVGAIFRGPYGGADQVAAAVEFHAGWDDTDPDLPFIDGSQGLLVRTDDQTLVCRNNDTERATEDSIPTPTERFHVRLWRIPSTSGGGLTTVGTPHYEIATTRDNPKTGDTCGTSIASEEYPSHAVTPNGFDTARHELKARFEASGSHEVKVVRWGNTRRVQQCTGEYAHSSGNVIRIRVDHRPRHN